MRELSPDDCREYAKTMARIGRELGAQADYFARGQAPQTKNKIAEWVDELIRIERAL
ncbi:MAG: hypothetical protein WBK28_02300 [Minisyncoccia bacterium]